MCVQYKMESTLDHSVQTKESNLLMFFLICGCGADIANGLDDPVEFWKSITNEGLEVGTLILVWRLSKEFFLFQWRPPRLELLRWISWEISQAEKQNWRKQRRRCPVHR